MKIVNMGASGSYMNLILCIIILIAYIKVLRALVSSQVASRARMNYSVFPFTIVKRSIGGSEVSLSVQTLMILG